VLPFPEEAIEIPRKIFLTHAENLKPDQAELDTFLAELGGLPLAIYLVARKADALGDFSSLKTLWERKKTEVLRVGSGAAEESLALVLQVSMDQILQNGRKLASILGLLPGGMSRADLVHLLPENWPEALEQLAEVGLIQAKPGRLTTLEPIREYFAEQVPAGEPRKEELFVHYLGLAATGEKVGAAGGGEVKQRLIPEVANIEAMFTRFFSSPPTRPTTPECISAAIGWSEFVRFSGHGTTSPLLQAHDVAAEETLLTSWANCTQSLGDIHLARSQHDLARDAYNKAIPLYQQVGRPTATYASAKYTSNAPNMTRLATHTTRPSLSTNKSETSSERPTASKASATSTSNAPNMTRLATPTTRPSLSSNKSVPSSERPTAPKDSDKSTSNALNMTRLATHITRPSLSSNKSETSSERPTASGGSAKSLCKIKIGSWPGADGWRQLTYTKKSGIHSHWASVTI